MSDDGDAPAPGLTVELPERGEMIIVTGAFVYQPPSRLSGAVYQIVLTVRDSETGSSLESTDFTIDQLSASVVLGYPQLTEIDQQYVLTFVNSHIDGSGYISATAQIAGFEPPEGWMPAALLIQVSTPGSYDPPVPVQELAAAIITAAVPAMTESGLGGIRIEREV